MLLVNELSLVSEKGIKNEHNINAKIEQKNQIEVSQNWQKIWIAIIRTLTIKFRWLK